MEEDDPTDGAEKGAEEGKPDNGDGDSKK